MDAIHIFRASQAKRNKKNFHFLATETMRSSKHCRLQKICPTEFLDSDLVHLCDGQWVHKCCNWENKSFCRPRSLSQINALTTLLYLGQKNQTRKWLFLSKLQTVFVQIVKCICHPFVNALPTLPYLETLNQCGINVESMWNQCQHQRYIIHPKSTIQPAV